LPAKSPVWKEHGKYRHDLLAGINAARYIINSPV
jgi:hypothetical protein